MSNGSDETPFGIVIGIPGGALTFIGKTNRKVMEVASTRPRIRRAVRRFPAEYCFLITLA